MTVYFKWTRGEKSVIYFYKTKSHFSLQEQVFENVIVKTAVIPSRQIEWNVLMLLFIEHIWKLLAS